MKNSNEFMTKTIVVCCGALFCSALWGSAFPFIKLGYAAFDIASSATGTQILFAGMRFSLAGVLAILLGSLINRKLLVPTRSILPQIFVLSMVQTVIQYFFFYVGLAHTTGVRSSIITGTNVFLALLISALVFRMETMSSRKIIGILIGFAGIVLINVAGHGLEGSFAIMGDGFICLSALSYAFSSVFLRLFSKNANPALLTGYQFLLGGIILIVIGLAFGGRLTVVTGEGIAILLWLAFVSAAAYSLWAVLLKYNPVSRVTVFGFMNSVFGVLLSAICLHETDTIRITTLISLVLVCTGIYICNSTDRNKENN